MEALWRIKYLPFYIISLIPTPLLLGISSLCYYVVYYVFGYRKKVVRENLKNSFPLNPEDERIEIEKNFYRHFCDVIFLTLKTLTISKAEVKKRFQVKNPSVIEEIYREHNNIILYSAHQGNWEWMVFLPLFLPNQCSSFYQPLSNAYFDQLMNMIRTRFGVVCVESKKGYRALLGFEKNQIRNLTYMIGDQSPHRKRPKYWTQFLNQETAFLLGTDRIARKMNLPVVFALSRRLGRGKYELEFQLLEANPKQLKEGELVEKYAKLLEEVICRDPTMYLWSHNRWKLKRNEE